MARKKGKQIREAEMKIYSMSNQKGGVAKTTSVINLAAALTKLGKKVLAIDMDPQGNLTSGLNQKDKFEKSIYDVLVSDFPIKQAIIHTEWEGLDLIPTAIKLANAELELANVMGRETVLQDILRDTKIAKEYDFIIIDTNPSLGLLTINALGAAEGVIIPMEPEIYSLEGIDYLIQVISLIKKKVNKDLEIAGVLLTKVHPQTRVSRDFQDEVKSIFKDKVFKTKININVKVQDAQSERTPVIFYDEKAKAAEQYMDLAKEIAAHG